MSRLDQHVAFVQGKLAFSTFLGVLARAGVVFFALVWIAVLVDRLFHVAVPQAFWVFWGGVGLTLLIAAIVAFLKRPTPAQAAVAIDERLNTQDKFATAIFARTSTDPFARAAVRDAEQTADNVSLHKRFPIAFPRAAYVTFLVGCGAALTAWLMGPVDLFAKSETHVVAQTTQQKQDEAKKQLKDALAIVNAVPDAVAQSEQVKLAKQDLTAMLNKGAIEPESAKRSAAKALQDLNEAIKQQVKTNQKFADAQQDAKLFKQLASKPITESGPIADAQRSLAKGDFSAAVEDIEEAVKNFDKKDEKEQQKTIDQMKQMAQQLQQAANDPEQKKQTEKQLEQMGMNQQQAQEMEKKLEQAANGDKDAQQQLQQMAQQAMQQMNNGQGPSQQQQQQLQQMMNQMQAQANSQAQAQQMAQAAQQMAQAMQQSQQAQQQQQQQGQQGQQGQQQQAGQQGQKGAQQQMAQAQQQMQQQLQQMQADQQAAQQMKAAQANAQQAMNQAMNGLNGQQGQQGGQQGQQGQADGKDGGQGNNGGQPKDGWGQNQGGQGGGNPNQPWNGQNAPAGPNNGGQGMGDRNYKAPAPFTVKQEVSQSQDDEKGKLLASTLVKAGSIKGESKAELKNVAESAEKQMTDEVDQDRISRQARNVVKGYFGSMQQDAETAPSPSK